MKLARKTLASALFALPFGAFAADPSLDEVVVTAPRMRTPLVVENDPKAPQQPVPSSDGASFLKNVPGFNLIRKAGTDGDPVLRGLAGSRLNVLLDGAEFHGGCGMRMDPPTAYVFPETYDRVRIVKGPQTVLYGNGNLAGVVLFERDDVRFREPGVRAHASLMGGSWGRLDAVADASFGTPTGFVRASATHSQSDDYRDGSGRTIHSGFERRSLSLTGGWTPDDDTRIELSAARSEAQAAYADRSMDGSVFDRDALGLKLRKTRVSELLRRVEVQMNWNYIDHVMDNYSLRAKPAAANFSWNNPDRETFGMRASADLALGAAALLTLGADRQHNSHSLRAANSAALVAIDSRPRNKDFESTSSGVFGELSYALSQSDRLIGGLRHDRYDAERTNAVSGAAMGRSSETLTAGFVRVERDLRALPATAYVGFGYGERPMDHWEATTWNGLTGASSLRPERNAQLDAGLIWSTPTLSGSLALFHSRIDDYVLTYVNPSASGSCGSNPAKCSSLNVDARRHGFEAEFAWRFAPQWTARGSYALVRARNESMGVALAQTPPDELRLGLGYASGAWTLGASARFVRAQDRVHADYGSIVGQDIGPSAGFATLSLNASYRIDKRVQLSAGIDNLFDRVYAEHINRAAAAVAGYDAPSTRVNEPGRMIWAKITVAID
ncbi:MAG: TonB-dependent copper receptor [Burkholderiaceae bacterium]|nr:TonB-dependent copper receptor [Burkholderiaceae bacterium]